MNWLTQEQIAEIYSKDGVRFCSVKHGTSLEIWATGWGDFFILLPEDSGLYDGAAVAATIAGARQVAQANGWSTTGRHANSPADKIRIAQLIGCTTCPAPFTDGVSWLHPDGYNGGSYHGTEDEALVVAYEMAVLVYL